VSLRRLPLCLALLLLLAGCESIGPATLPRDRFDYSSALGESWKYQTLLNIVKLRYMDTPIFVDVAQVISAYELETTLSAGAGVGFNNVGSFLSGEARGRYRDRPTITYSPLTGDQYLRGIMTPIRPEAIFSAIPAGWPADIILFTSVASINHLNNQHFGGRRQGPADPEFIRLIELVRMLEEAGALGFRVKDGPDRSTENRLVLRRETETPALAQAVAEVKQLLRLAPDRYEFDILFGRTPRSDHEIAVQTRSLLGIMFEVSAQTDVPPQHLAEGRATPGFVDRMGDRQNVRVIQIHATQERSPFAFISIRYRDHWFWIDDRDLRSKRNFAFLMFLFSLAETGERRSLPVITIPAQ
jgi:hypothetical protein